ncbi:uncharacterized protein LOC141691599 [Apium graveolens]|uniref:uncharacterized protein LOC141691599 n=1 Tax=Apium graveolens TaxID=4045 RepID=UPI003D7930C9
MDESEEIPQQENISSGSADQMANVPPPFTDTPDAVATNVSVPVISTMQPPPVSSSDQHQLANQEAQAQHLQYVRERLRQYWANQMQEMKPEDFKTHSLPISPIKRIMKADKDVKMIAKETAAVFAKACEMFILDLTSQAWINTEADGRRLVQNKDLAAAISKTDLYDFLEDVIPRDQLKEQISKATNSRQQVAQQHGVGSSNAGGQQPPAFMPLYQSGPQNQQSFVLGPHAQYQQNQQPSTPWPQAQYQQIQQQQPSTPWPQAQYQQIQQQPSMPWPQTPSQQNHQPSTPWHQAQYQQIQQQLSMPWPQTPSQQNHQQPFMPWLQDEDEIIPDQEDTLQAFLSSPQDEDVLIPDQENPGQAFPSSPQDELLPDQHLNNN